MIFHKILRTYSQLSGVIFKYHHIIMTYYVLHEFVDTLYLVVTILQNAHKKHLMKSSSCSNKYLLAFSFPFTCNKQHDKQYCQLFVALAIFSKKSLIRARNMKGRVPWISVFCLSHLFQNFHSQKEGRLSERLK